jgi:hypothetical protein
LPDLSRRSIGIGIVGTIAFVLTATAALMWLAVDGVRYLPAMYLNTLQQTRLPNKSTSFYGQSTSRPSCCCLFAGARFWTFG